ncbi:MAG: hypothetical protein KKA07_18880 [Bacteroidetes bacterium]|nr:hypothetical protein [Bacteroidota bacterium]MBU1721138.1 hypothetical protein [Bacteroidota bacterium]
MENYVNQLISDIRSARQVIEPPHDIWHESEANPCDPVELEDISYVEQFVYGEEEPIEKITRIAQELLPPPGNLSPSQMEQLAVELEKLLEHYNFKLDFPEKMPPGPRYPFIRDFWTESHVPLSFGENHIEFCDYDEENCPFPGYCNTCEEFRKEEEEYERRKNNQTMEENDELPF